MSEYNRVEETEIEKIDLFRILNNMVKGGKRYWFLFIIMICFFTIFHYFKAYRSYSPVYTANATFTVTRDDSSLTTNTYLDEHAASLIVKTFPYILNGGQLQKLIKEDLGVTAIPGTIKTEILGSTNMITIVVQAYKEEDAIGILESVIARYPEVAEPVVGEVKMNLLDITKQPENTAAVPSFSNSLIKGVMMSCVLGIAALFLYSFFRNTVYEEDDFKKMLNIDCICAIPQIIFKKRGREFKKDISIYNKKISQTFLESIRVLRARIEKDAKKNDIKIFLVTSAAPGEGKSTIAANIAMSLAMGGSKVTLVDCDLRNPSVRELLDIEKEGLGLYEVLIGKAEVADVLLYDEVHKINVLPGGEIYGDGSELLDNPKMKEILNILKKENDYVILDTAPVGMLTDTAVLAQEADAALFVVKQDYASCTNILEGISQLAESRVYISGCILNGAQAGIGGYGYRYYRYYNRYGYYNSGSHYGDVKEAEE